MSLQLKAVDRIFERLTATYGRYFLGQWEGVDKGVVMASWAYELSGFSDNLHAIAWALENLPERAPNVIEFRNLCRRAPAAVLPALPQPQPDPERVAGELAKLAPLRSRTLAEQSDKSWARRLVERVEQGDRTVGRFAAQAAYEALRLPRPARGQHA